MIRTLLLSSVVIAAIAGTAVAADLPSRRAPPVYAPPPPIPVFTWTGFYVGAQVGYEFGKSTDLTTIAATGAPLFAISSNRNGVIGGGHVGYLVSTQSLPVFGSLFGAAGGFGTGGVVGIEGDVDGSSATTTFTALGLTNVDRDRIQGSIRGRLGVAFDRVLVYATGGAAFGDFRNTFSFPGVGFDSFSHTRVGYTVGGGVEYAFTNNWSVGVEYRYTDFGRYTDNPTNSTGGLVNVTHHETDNRVQGRLNYKFETPVAPVVARY